MDHPKKIKYKGATYVRAGTSRFDNIDFEGLANTGGHADSLLRSLTAADHTGRHTRPIPNAAYFLNVLAKYLGTRAGNVEDLSKSFYGLDHFQVVDDDVQRQIATALAIYDLADDAAFVAENMLFDVADSLEKK